MKKYIDKVKSIFQKKDMFDKAKELFEYARDTENGEIINHDVHDFGGVIEGRVVTCKGIFYIKQVFIFKDDAIIKKEG